MQKTSIEWVKNPDGSQGYTWNPITGCLNGCPYCYARKLANGRLRSRYLSNTNVIVPNSGFPNWSIDPFYPRFWEDRIQELAKRNDLKPRGIFVCGMGELFGDWIPTNWQWNVFEVIKHNPQHRFYLLTKQPQKLIKFSPFPPNCYVGVTATNAKMFRLASNGLWDIKAKVKYISLEPLLDWDWQRDYYRSEGIDYLTGINWLIIGAQTNPYKPPKIEWVEEIVRAADKAGIPVFLKDNLKPLLETLDITGTSFGRLTSLTVEAIKDTQGLPRQRGWYKLRQEVPE